MIPEGRLAVLKIHFSVPNVSKGLVEFSESIWKPRVGFGNAIGGCGIIVKGI